MKIKLYWPNCNLNFRDVDVDFNGNDAFFLECSLEEAKEQLFDRLTEDQIHHCLSDYDPCPDSGQLEFGIETDKVCFLITKDQNVLLPEPWYFPYSGQWNAYNPFQRIKEIEIKNIGELSGISAEVEATADIEPTETRYTEHEERWIGMEDNHIEFERIEISPGHVEYRIKK